jgi:hypothetical protein
LITNASRHHDQRGDGGINLQVPLFENIPPKEKARRSVAIRGY